MVGLALCLPSVGQPQGLPVPREIPKTHKINARQLDTIPIELMVKVAKYRAVMHASSNMA
jgi:hypothetical protein